MVRICVWSYNLNCLLGPMCAFSNEWMFACDRGPSDTFWTMIATDWGPSSLNCEITRYRLRFALFFADYLLQQ